MEPDARSGSLGFQVHVTTNCSWPCTGESTGEVIERPGTHKSRLLKIASEGGIEATHKELRYFIRGKLARRGQDRLLV